MSFLFENGIHGTGIWNFASFERYDITEIVGDKGKIAFSTFGDDPIHIQYANGEKENITIENPLHIQQPFIETVIEEILGNKGKSPSKGISGARTTWVIDEVLKEFRNSN
jgi:hypothetical protein